MDSASAASAALFASGGDVGRDHAQVDWAATALGPPQGWPQSLQTAVSILLSSRFPMWMAWGPDLTFFCNDAYRRDTLGQKYPWALGRPAREVWAEIWKDIEPRINQVLSTGEATWDTSLLLFLQRSGYPEETYHTFSYSPLRDDDEQVVGMLCVVSEDTQQVIGERRMATLRDLGSDPSVVRNESEILNFSDRQLSQNLADLPFTLTYLFDDVGDAVLAGATGLVRGHPAAPPTQSATGEALWPMQAAARGETVLVDLDTPEYVGVPSGDWPEAPMEALVVPLLQQGGSPSGFLVAALNRYRPLDDAYRGFVTLVAGHIAAGLGLARSYRVQQRRADELAELDRAKTAFFSNISHEFRTPLTLILDPVAELRQAEDVGDRTRRELDVVWRNGLRLTKLVNTLLEFSRIEAGRTQARYEPVDVGATTAELASVFRSAVDRAGLALVVDCPSLDQPVYLDRDMWEKVVFNLLSNALKFTFEGTISVGVRREADEAVITFADTGIGVPAAEIPRLFERFHRIENARARSNEGSGIGLALVQELVALHGGTIAAESAEGVGTTFTVRLPFGVAHLPPDAVVATPLVGRAGTTAETYVQEALRWMPADAERADVAPPPPARPAVGAAEHPARVLIADDNADMRDYLARLLRADGYAVDAVGDGRQALDAIRDSPPDIVISDVMMPRLDGLELVAALRADRRTSAVPVLLLSARAGQEASIGGLQAGADDYLVKPFAAAELLARVRANVELARLRNHHARWRTALVESLQEGFFVCDEHGAVIEINAAFTEILGFDTDGLPYEPPFPWWPPRDSDSAAHRRAVEALDRLLEQPKGSLRDIPVIHRDGRRRWVSANFNHTADPDTGRRVTVGTMRDVTAERYAGQRETALAALNERLVQATTVDDAVLGAAEALRGVWDAERVDVAVFPTHAAAGSPVPHLVCAGAESAGWDALPARTRQAITALCDGDLLVPDHRGPGTTGIAVPHPKGVLVVHLQLREPRPFTSEELALLTVLGGRLGQGLQRIHRVDQQRETALALQHAILGPAVPAGFAVRYQPATRPLQVGGDWYDVVDLDDGRIGLIVGDCVGHGLAAATVMGQLRSAFRALLLETPGPAAALSAMDRFASRLSGARCTTAFCAVLHPDTGELVYSGAGHPPPILVRPGHAPVLLDGAAATPLGLADDRVRPEAQTTMPPRATLLLYTDGLVERRREALDDGIGRAAEVMAHNAAATLDDLAKLIMTQLAPGGGYQDDVALLLYRQPAPLEMDLAADVEVLASSRAALRGWLTRAGVNAEQTLDVLIATGEALANAIEHGHRHLDRGRVTLRATAVADRLHVTVVDTGSWKPPVAAVHRGRGITLMKGLMHDVTIEPDVGGTTVHMHTRIV
ncbi:Sensor histidine kinase TmoS [Mycolicibacterium vanbaalenii]|uniref:histidine kinase n=1 Tax=Mycolicibacterium vanbaalenii TaxID=110539 RepID=A0A5S9NUE3_MYCVN|nr:SpoIIE family protein phosphatase [Mycolicibacterium vanbaalenii]CAA0094249.1 Sensor histidine kinase TmoS [Mycolicibacterium vanbaalenii]